MDRGVRILLADDHQIVREGLRQLLEAQPDFAVVAETGDGLAVAPLAASLRPNVLVLDLRLPGLGGLEVLRRVRHQSPSTRVVMLSMYDSPAYVAKALAGGACGYVLKTSAADELVRAIRSALAGRQYLDASLPAEAIGQQRRLASRVRDPYEALTPREREVLHMVGEGLSSAEIAGRLSISPRTVEMYRRHIAGKLDLTGQAALARYALQRGLLPPS
jgi:DNA-binding NarL/FixJ family response regulator